MQDLLLFVTTGNSDLDWIVAVLLWIARCLVLGVFCGTGLYKFVKGVSDEQPSLTKEGLTLVVAGGAVFAASFALTAIF